MLELIEKVKLKLSHFVEKKYIVKDDELISWLFINAKN